MADARRVFVQSAELRDDGSVAISSPVMAFVATGDSWLEIVNEFVMVRLQSKSASKGARAH